MDQCNRRGESYRKASLGAGIANNGIAEIVNSGSQPSLDRVLKLAKYFGVSPEFLIRLAGDLPEPTNGAESPRQSYLNELLSNLPPQRRDVVVDAAIMLAEVERVLNEQEAGILRQSSPSERGSA